MVRWPGFPCRCIVLLLLGLSFLLPRYCTVGCSQTTGIKAALNLKTPRWFLGFSYSVVGHTSTGIFSPLIPSLRLFNKKIGVTNAEFLSSICRCVLRSSIPLALLSINPYLHVIEMRLKTLHIDLILVCTHIMLSAQETTK